MPGFYPLGGAGEKLPPQNLVTDHDIQEIFGLNRIKSDLKTSQIRKFPGGYSPRPPTQCVLL